METKADDGVVQINYGKYVEKARQNPWMPSTIVLALILVIVLFYQMNGSGITGNVVNEQSAADNLISFINSQGKGNAELVSVTKQDGMYNVVVKYNGQDIPVFITLDGKYLISDRIPLTSDSLPPSDPVVDNSPKNIVTGDSPGQGNKNAKVVLVEFSDYECPFCGKYYSETYSQLKKDYIDTGKVYYVFKDFPLSFHPQAQKSAEAARCARDQGGDVAYFKMHDKLFSNQQSLSVDNYKKWAKELGLNGAKFDTCLDSGKFASAVAADESYGQSVGVQGTPGFFINGRGLSGAQPYSAFKTIIDEELAK